MTTATRIGRERDFENLSGWVIRFRSNNGQGQWMRGVSRAAAMRIANSHGDDVYSVRGFIVENGTYIELV